MHMNTVEDKSSVWNGRDTRPHCFSLLMQQQSFASLPAHAAPMHKKLADSFTFGEMDNSLSWKIIAACPGTTGHLYEQQWKEMVE